MSFGIVVDTVRVWLDNRAALTITMCGATWRTRYFACRGHRLHEEYERGSIDIRHCAIAGMIADCLTKLAAAPVIAVLHEAMEGHFPDSTAKATERAARTAEPEGGREGNLSIGLKSEIVNGNPRHRTRTSPGPENSSDYAGDGPPKQAPCKRREGSLSIAKAAPWQSRSQDHPADHHPSGRPHSQDRRTQEGGEAGSIRDKCADPLGAFGSQTADTISDNQMQQAIKKELSGGEPSDSSIKDEIKE